MADPWVFTQLAGERKVLTLADADAPHGRPRKAPIVKQSIKVRASEDYYSGTPEPTRHIFGIKLGPWDLNGRYSDTSRAVAGYCQKKLEFTLAFVADAQEVLIEWGDQIRARGLIEEFTAGRESPQESTWEMHLLLNADERLAHYAQRDTQLPADIMTTTYEMQSMLMQLTGWKKPDFALKGSILDAVSGVLDALTSPFVALNNLANDIQSFERALLGDIKRFRARLDEARQAVLTLQDTVSELTVGLAVESQRAQEQFNFTSLQADTATITNDMLVALVKTDKDAREAERGKTKGLYTAIQDDTWEAISASVYDGVATRGEDIRKANGVPSGTPPELGALYVIPV